ncbi:MAG: DNA mismatch repair protein MutS [Prevotellaceae bacterium]|jgi:dsDNA-specific endonuclease/ATPase MutS2|nr:DNA mismatch repair protein MutS [Prevotellaceae bacterium]
MSLLLKHQLEKSPALRYIIDGLNLQTALARHSLYSLSWNSNAKSLEEEFAQIAKAQALLRDVSKKAFVNSLTHTVAQLHDCRRTVEHLQQKVILDDVELFEIKHLALLVGELRKLLCEAPLVELPDLENVVRLLDPNNTRTATFHIYDKYSVGLMLLRQQLQTQPKEQEAYLLAKCTEEEDRIRALLSDKLRPFVPALQTAIERIAYLDLLLAKAEQAIREGFSAPKITSGQTVYQGLFNPQIKADLLKQGNDFQPVDITFGNAPVLLTGINMGGKTVVLHTVALAQMLCQYGFYLPVRLAKVALVEEVICSAEETQKSLNGLSSFASEMMQINKIIDAIRHQTVVLALVDEPARTTNPAEGRAIVDALIQLFNKYNVRGLITTHYDHITTPCRRLRVRGFRPSDTERNIKQLLAEIDYTLQETDEQNVPHEAMRIAEILGLDSELIALAKEKIT